MVENETRHSRMTAVTCPVDIPSEDAIVQFTPVGQWYFYTLFTPPGIKPREVCGQ